MSTTIQARDEVIPGYVLDERIGTGGYAEVWRARAPGGIDKAVKIVNGYYDEEFAAQEMKALERIKDVRHPFLLSLERFEVVNGRLAILTELADMSLEQRAQECRGQGLSGIPRQELLQYMSDTAEALDYLVQRYGLQHLDIKPANLLILGEHVKVADFGLVKELTTRTQNSLVAGMTPTYASPEMFDDAPTSSSDQYSLAIVYQELLVGVRAFPGRTAAQLAKQHTQAAPQLTALPAHDRPIVARALAKDPSGRYPTCRAFVDALIHSTDTGGERGGKGNASNDMHSPPAGAAQQNVDTKSALAGATKPSAPPSPGIVTQPVGRPQHDVGADSRDRMALVVEAHPVEETADVSVPEVDPSLNATQSTLFIAVGGVGIRVLSRLREMAVGDTGADGAVDSVAMLAIDTDRAELREACSHRRESHLKSDDTLHLTLRLPQDYGDDSRDLLAWLSRRWLYNIPRSLETQGYRPLGRIALVDHAEKVLALVNRKLKRLQSGGDDKQATKPESIRVVVVAGMGGGTGAGMVIDLANAARSCSRALGMEAEVHGVLISNCLGGANAATLAAANTYALLTELHHTFTLGNRGALSQLREHPFESDGPPFDHVYCVPAQSRAKGGSQEAALHAAATYLAMETNGTARGILRTCRKSTTPKESTLAPTLALRSFGCARLSDVRNNQHNEDGSADKPNTKASADDPKLDNHRPACEGDVQQILERVSVDLLRCGSDRRTMLLVRSGETEPSMAALVTAARPTTAVVATGVEKEIVVCEATGIHPRSLAIGLERVYPGITDAAGRLLTRVDVSWQPLL